MDIASSLGLDRVPMNKETCLVGMGNTLLRDDGAGVYIAEGVNKGIASGGLRIQVVEDVLEAYAFKLAELDCANILIVDAIQTTGEPGSVAFGELAEFTEILNDFSTHKLALNMCEKIFNEHGKKTYLLGINAGDVDFGEGMTRAVKETADLLIETLVVLANADKAD